MDAPHHPVQDINFDAWVYCEWSPSQPGDSSTVTSAQQVATPVSTSPFTCADNECNCGRNFPRRRDLKAHIDQRTKPHICPTCGRGFGKSCDRTRHMREKHGSPTKLYCPVEICKRHFKSFARVANLLSHMRNKHDGDVSAMALTSPEASHTRAESSNSAAQIPLWTADLQPGGDSHSLLLPPTTEATTSNFPLTDHISILRHSFPRAGEFTPSMFTRSLIDPELLENPYERLRELFTGRQNLTRQIRETARTIQFITRSALDERSCVQVLANPTILSSLNGRLDRLYAEQLVWETQRYAMDDEIEVITRKALGLDVDWNFTFGA